MAEQRTNIMNPTLALAQLYKKDGKGFKEVIEDVTARMNSLGMDLTSEYVKNKILPWVLSFQFMTVSHQILDEYIKELNSSIKKNPV